MNVADKNLIDYYRNGDVNSMENLSNNNNEEYVNNSFTQLSNVIKNKSSLIIQNPELNEVIFDYGNFGDLTKNGNNGDGIIHIVQRRYEIDGLSNEDIASLLFLIKNYSETEIPSGYDDTNTRAFINKNGIRIILQKNWREDNRNWLVTGYGIIDSNTKKLSLEATETIKTVNAQYGYKPEHSRLREQVGAVIASISSIRQQQEKVKVLKSRTKIEKGIKTISTANPKTVYDRAVLKTNPKNSSDKDLITAFTAINFAINSLENKNKSDLFKHTKAKKLIEKAANKKLLSAVEKELLSRGYTFEAHNSVNETSTNYQRVVIMDISNGKERQVSLKNTSEPQSDSQVLENPMTEHSNSSKTNIIHETVSDNNNTKNIHNSTWQWVHYDDASGSIRSPEGESYFSYDWTTKEYKENNGSIWEMFEGAPDENTDFEAFQKYAEDCIRKYIAKDPSIVFTNKYVDRDFSYKIASGLSDKITPDLFDEITQVVYDMGYDCKCSFTCDINNHITDFNFELYDENVNCESLSFVDLINKIIENNGKEITQLHQGVDDKEIDKLNNFVKSLEEIKKSFSNEKPLWDEVVNTFISFGFPINKYNKDDFFTMLSYNMETSAYCFIKKDNKIYIHDNSDNLEDDLFTEERITAFFENCVDSLRNKNDKNLNWQINMVENLLLEHKNNVLKYELLDIGKYFNSHLPESTEIFNEEEINNLKIYTQELSGDVLLYDKINDKAYRVFNFDNDKWIETHDKNLLNPVDSAELLNFARIEAEEYRDTAKSNGQITDSQEADMWARRFHEKLVYIQARNFSDLSICPCKKVEDFEPDKDDISNPVVNVSEYNIILNNENIIALNLEKSENYTYELFVKFGKDTKITEYKIVQKDNISGNIIKENVENELKDIQKEIWDLSKSYVEQYLHYSIDNDFDITCDYAFSETRKYSNNGNEESLTVYEEPRWSFKNNEDILQIVKNTDENFYDELQNVIKSHPGKIFAFDLGKEIVYSEAKNGDENDLSDETLKEKLDNEFIFRYWNVYGDDEINNFEDYGEHIFIKDQTVVDKLNKMIENHVNNNIERYKDFKNYRNKRLPELLKKELWEHGEPSLTVDGDGNYTKRFQTFTIEDELQNLLGLANFTYGNNPVKYALFADYELNSEGGIKNEPQIKLWEYYDYNNEEIHTKDSGKALENNFFITPSCLKLIEDTFDLVACENTQETFYSRDYYKMSQVFEGMNIAFGDKSNIPFKDTFAYNFHYICREFKQKDIPETLEEHNDVLFTTITHLIMDNFDFGKLDYNNFDEQFGIEGVDYRWDICDKTANALLKGKIVSTKHIQDFIYDEGDKIVNELEKSGKYNNLTAVNDIQEKGFTLILEKYENDEYGKEIAEEIKNYKYPEKEKLVDNVFSMLKEHYKNGEYLVTMETSNDDKHTIELKYSPSELEVLIKARDAFKYGTESLSFVRPNAEQIEDGINNYLTFDEITKGYLLCCTLEDRLINDSRLRNITNIEKANAMFVFESDEDAARQYEKDNKTGLLKEKRDIWIGDDDISSYSIPDTPENRKALKNYILDKPLLEKFNFEEFKEADFNRMKSDLLNHHYIDFMYGSIHLGSISIDFQQREDGIIDVDPYILGEKGIGGEIELNNSDDSIPYSENALCQFSLKEIENLNYDDFKNWVKDFLVEKIEKDSDSKHLLKEARRITIDWNNDEQCKALYNTKLGEELVEIMARNPLSMNENDKKDAEELLLKGADPKEALLFAAADANLLENCHWLLNHLPYGNAGIFQDKNFADSIYEIAKESVTLDEESWQDVCDIGYYGFEEIAKLCGRLDEAEKYYNQLKEKHPELSDIEGDSWENLEKQFKDEKFTPVRGDFASIKKDIIDSMRSKDMYDYKEHQKEVVCRILCDVMDFGPLNESVEEEGGLENHSVHSERNKSRWNIVENIAEKIVNNKIAVKEYQKEADKIISDIIDTDLTNKTNIQGEITMNENESIENIEKKLDVSLLKFIKKLDELRINSDKDNNYSALVVDIPRSELKKTELFKDDTNYPLPGNGLRLIIQNDSFGFKIDIGTAKYQYDISIYKYTQDGKSSRASSPLSENVPAVNEGFGISILGHSDKDKLNNKFFFYANKDIIIEKTIEACRQKQEKIRLEKEKKEAEEQSYENSINSLAEELGITDSNKSPDVSFNSFINDIDKMRDFDNMEKKDFLSFYSYLSEEEYDNTRQELLNIGRSGKEQAEYLENQLDYEPLLHEVFDSTIETLDPIIDKIKLWHPEDYGFPKNEKTHLLVEFHNNEEFVGKTFTETEIENIFLNSNVKFEGKNIDVIVLDSKTKSISQFLKNADISKQFRKDFGLNDFGPAANDLDEIYYEIKVANPDSSFNELFEEAVFRKIEETFDMHGFESLLGGREPELDSTLNSDVMTEHSKLLEKVAEEYADGKLLYDDIQNRIDGLLEENKLFQKLVGEGRLPEINNFNLGIKKEPELDKYPGLLGFSIGHNDANGSDYINFSVRFDKENTSLRKLKGFDENAETQKWDRINILYYLDWPDTPSEISLRGKNSYLVLDEYSALTKDLSFNDLQKIRRSAQTFIENYLESQYKGLNLEQAFFTEPAPEPGFVVKNSTDLCTVMNNHNKSSSSEPNIDTETAAAILNYLNFRDWKVYEAKGDVYVLDVSEDYDREGHKSNNGDILDLAHDAAYIAKEDGTGYYDKDSYKLVMNAWKEYKQWKKEQHKISEHENTDTVSPTDEIGQIAKESLLQDVPVLFKKEIIKKLHKDEYKNNPFAAAGSVIKEWKKDCPEYIPILDKYMIDNGFIEKKGYEKFFKDIVGLKKKQPEKSMENKQKKKLSSKDDDFSRS